MMALAMLFVSSAVNRVVGQIIAYEGKRFPESEGWIRLPEGAPHGDRAIEDGWLVQTVRLPSGWPGPTGEQDSYRTDLGCFAGINRFFVEWRAITDNPPWLIDLWQVPAVVSAAGYAASLYHTVLTESAAVLLRDLDIPREVVPVSSNAAHTFRVEVFPDRYIWYVDGIVKNYGGPEGPYPDPNGFLVWGVNREYVDATTAWDFVRAGVIPMDGSGDYDSDGAVTLADQYFVDDCLTKDGPGIFGGPGNDAGPGCRFADFDADADVDLLDFAEFQNLFGGSHP